jgi:hypothetical protein
MHLQRHTETGASVYPQGRNSRSRLMVECLRKEFVYSEKRARDILFAEIATILGGTSGRSIIVSRLVREASARARRRAELIGFDFSNWDTAAKATVNAMLGAGVLLTCDGLRIPLTVAAQATEVTALADGFVDIAEAYLLDVLIRKMGDITVRDHTALAHALFRQFDPNIPMEDMEDRVAVLLAMLWDRVVITDNGLYCAVEGCGQAG